MFSASGDSFRQLLDRLAEEHYCKIQELTSEIEHLRAAALEIGRPQQDDAVLNVEDINMQSLEVIEPPAQNKLLSPTNAVETEAAAAIVAGSHCSILAKALPLNDPVLDEGPRLELPSISASSISSKVLKHITEENVVDVSAGPGRSSKSAATAGPLQTDIECKKAVVHEVWHHQARPSNWACKFNGIMKPRESMAPRFSTSSDEAVRCSGFTSCRPPMRPSSHFKVFWDLTGIIALASDVIFIPMQVFDLPGGNTSFIGILDWFCISFWTMDLPLNFCVGYYTSSGRVVMHLKTIARRYLKRWFPIDLLIISVDWLTVSFSLTGSSDNASDGAGLLRLGKIMRIIRSMRTLRLLRLAKLRRMVSFVFDLIESEWLSLLLGTLTNLCALVCVNHGIACLWFWLGSSTSPGITWVKVYNFTTAGWEDQYVASMHWTLTQFTPATASVIATNPEERLFSVIVLIFAMVVFSSFLSSITSAMTRLRAINSYRFQQSLLLNKFLRQNRISRDLALRVTRYVKLCQSHFEAIVDESKVEFLKLLSGPLKVQLQWEVHGPVLREHPFFRKASIVGWSAMQHLCYRGISSASFAKQDVLFHWGVKCDKMYFPLRGWLFYRRPPGFVRTPRYVVLTRDQWFCENVLWTPWKHRGLMKTLTEVTINTLHVSEFHATVRAHPDIFSIGRRYAMGFVEVMNEPDQSRPFTWDVPWEIMYPDSDQTWTQHVQGKKGQVNEEVFDAFDREAQLVELEYTRCEEDDE